MKRSQPSLRHIADRAGVTAMTVSRALRGGTHVSRATAEKIRRIAKQVGYRPDPQVTRLMTMLRTSRTRRPESVLAVINTRSERGYHLREPHLRILYEGALRRATELGYKLDEFWLADPALPPRRQQSILQARGIEGLLLLPFDQVLARLPLDLDRFAVSGIGRSQAVVPCDRAAPNHFAAMKLALDQLGRRGLHRVGLALFDGVNERTDHRYSAAFLDHSHQIAAEQRVPPLIAPRWEPSVFRAWWDAHRPEVLVTHGEHIRSFAERDLELRAPRDYGFVNLNRILTDDTSAGVDQNYGLVGSAAVDLLAGQVNHQERGLPKFPKIVTIGGVWHEGDSLPPPPRRRRAARP